MRRSHWSRRDREGRPDHDRDAPLRPLDGRREPRSARRARVSRRAAAYFGASLAFHADVSDVAAALAAGGDPGFVVLDSRSTESWDQGHVPGAIHLPTALIPEQAEQLLDKSVPVVTYCWGPGCNGATRAALALAELGFQVKEMLGGFEYWAREGFEFETWEGRERRAADPLTAPVGRGGLRLLSPAAVRRARRRGDVGREFGWARRAEGGVSDSGRGHRISPGSPRV